MEIEIIKFFGKGCGQCKAMDGILDAVLKERPEIKITPKDVADNQPLVEEHDITTLPTLLIYKDGVLVDKLAGLKPKALILKNI